MSVVDADERPPHDFLCPIMQELMENPVLLEDGFSYEKAAIERWFQESRRRPPLSPMTGAPLSSTNLTPNKNLRSAITVWQQRVADQQARQRESSRVQSLSTEDLAALRESLEQSFDEDVQFVVESILQVSNKSLERAFNTKRAAIGGRTIQAYHGTSPEAAMAICREGFRLPTADSDGDFIGQGARVTYDGVEVGEGETRGEPLMFGQAIYLTEELSKATRFAQGSVLVCQCAVGSVLEAETADYDLTPEAMRRQRRHTVYAKAGCQDSGGCRHAEYAFYDIHQVKPMYVVQFRLVSRRHGVLTPVAVPMDENRDRYLCKDYPLERLCEYIGDRAKLCKLLANLGRDDQRVATVKIFKHELMQQEIASACVGSNENALFEALRALWNFAFSSEINQTSIVKSIGVGVLLRHLGHANRTIAHRACGVVWSLTQCQTGRTTVLLHGGTAKLVDLLMKSLTLSGAKPWGLVRNALGALANLTIDEGARQELSNCVTDVILPFFVEAAGVPDEVVSEALRVVSNTISNGVEDDSWKKAGYMYRSSAPAEPVV